MPKIPMRTLMLGVLIVIILLALLGWRAGCKAADNARREASIAAATGKALDKVAAETPVIRQDQQEKEDAVEKIEGADQPLPPGFGAELERVRRGNGHPRQP